MSVAFRVDLDTQLNEGDVIALDETFNPHPFRKESVFVLLFDHGKNINVWSMNLVTGIEAAGLRSNDRYKPY